MACMGAASSKCFAIGLISNYRNFITIVFGFQMIGIINASQTGIRIRLNIYGTKNLLLLYVNYPSALADQMSSCYDSTGLSISCLVYSIKISEFDCLVNQCKHSNRCQNRHFIL